MTRFTIPDHLQTLLREQQFSHYALKADPGTKLEDVMDPAAFVHCRKKVRPNDVFTVLAQDGTYEADFRVVSVNHVTGEMKFRLLRHWTPQVGEAAQAAGELKDPRYKARWNPGRKHFDVVEIATGNVVAEPFGSKADAEMEAARLEAVMSERKAA